MDAQDKLTTIAANLVKKLGWSEPYPSTHFATDFQGKVLLSRTHWVVLVPLARLTRERAESELEKWFQIHKKLKSSKPARIDIIFLPAEEPPSESKALTKLNKRNFLGAGVYLGYLTPSLSSNVLPMSEKSVKAALTEGAKQAQEGPAVEEEAYQALIQESAQAYLKLEDKLQRVKPLGTWAILATCLVMFLWAEFLGGGTENVFTLFLFGANYPPVTLGGEWWRVVGATFMHIGWIHLFVNMYSLLAVGCLLEQVYGNFKYLALYALAGLGGSLASAYLGSGAISAGASGALFGLFGATALVGYRYGKEFPPNFRQALSQGMIPAIAYNLIYGFSSTSIDNAAHLGGLGTGILFALLVRPDIISHKARHSFVLPLAILGILPFVVQGYVAYRAIVYSAFDSYPTRQYKDNRQVIEATLPNIFEEKTEEGERYLAGPGINVVLFSAEDLLNFSADQESLKNSILSSFPDAQLSLKEQNGLLWLLDDGNSDGTVRRRAFTFLADNLFKIEIYAGTDNAKLAGTLREIAMSTARLPGWEEKSAVDHLLQRRLYGRALLLLDTLEDKPDNQVAKVVCLINLRQFDEALKIVENQGATWPDATLREMLLAQILEELTEYEKALSVVHAALNGAQGEKREELLLQRASIFYNAGREAKAEDDIETLLRSDRAKLRGKVLNLKAWLIV